MKIYSRINIKPKTDRYPFRVPPDVRQEAEDLCQELSKYCIDEEMLLLLIPIDSDGYRKVRAFITKHSQYFEAPLELFERRYTRGEVDAADFLTLGTRSILYTSERNENEYCCERNCFVTGSVGNLYVEPRGMKNKNLAFTTNYRFVVSERLKTILESNQLTNICFHPVLHPRREMILGYQIEPIDRMPPIHELNGWHPYLLCKKTGKIVYEANSEDPLKVTKKIVSHLKDFNATMEAFTELGAPSYIISRKMHEVLKEANVKSLDCEPVYIK